MEKLKKRLSLIREYSDPLSDFRFEIWQDGTTLVYGLNEDPKDYFTFKSLLAAFEFICANFVI